MSTEANAKPQLRSIDLENENEVDEAAQAVLEEERRKREEEDQRRFGISGVDLRQLRFSLDADGNRKSLLSNRTNAATILKNAEATRRMLGWDEFTQSMVLWHDVPQVYFDQEHECWVQTDPPVKDAPQLYEDTHTGQIQLWLQNVGHLPHCSDTLAYQAAETTALEYKFHPIRDYLSGVKWDGVERARSVLTNCFGVEDNEYSRRVAEIFWVSCVKRIFVPGCKSDYMMILEGDQGLLKSTFFNILAGEYFSDGLGGNIDTKDACQHLSGKWIIEFAELTSVKRSEAEAMKQFISRQVEKYRPPYGRKEIVQPRQCVFVGTTNEEGYLKDSTGNRRYLPVACVKRLDVDWLKSNRDQLWAEAVTMFRSGITNWPDPEFEKKYMKPEQDARAMEDPWMDILDAYVGGCAIRSNATYEKIVEKLGINPAQYNSFVRKRIKDCLKRLGYEFVKHKDIRYWQKPGKQWTKGEK